MESLVPGSENKGLCCCCHKFFSLEDGERVKELEHITVACVTEKHLCSDCEHEREAWNG